MKTFNPNQKDIIHKTYLFDASGKTLGRLATRVASLLIGKGKTFVSPDVLCGDYVVVVNAEKVHVTGQKRKQKIYTHYTGYSGGLRTVTFEKLQAVKPEEIITLAVSRMLPKNRLGDEMLRRLRVYRGPEHRQKAQNPIVVKD